MEIGLGLGVLENGLGLGEFENGLGVGELENGLGLGELENGLGVGELENGLGELENGLGELENGLWVGELENGLCPGDGVVFSTLNGAASEVNWMAGGLGVGDAWGGVTSGLCGISGLCTGAKGLLEFSGLLKTSGS